MSSALLEAVRGLRVAEPGLGVKPLLARLREQQPDLAPGAKEVREALAALKAESEAKAAAAPSAADEGGAPAHAGRASLALAAPGRRQTWATAGRSIRSARGVRQAEAVPTTYFCGPNCPGNPQTWKVARDLSQGAYGQQKAHEVGGVAQQNHEVAEPLF